MKLFKTKNHSSIRTPEKLLEESSVQTRYAEAFRTLRTNIHFAGLDKNINSLLISSAGATEGKTNTVANLGWTIARQNKSVLLIDCDLRCPSLSLMVKKKPSIGMTGIVANVIGHNINGIIKGGYTVSDIFTLINFQKKTGRLLVRDKQETIALFFLKGKLVDLAWPTRPQHLKLSTQLLNNKILNKEQLAIALKRQQDSGHRLGFIINNLGLVDESALKGILTIHAMEALHQVNGMTNNAFKFDELPEKKIDTNTSELVNLPQLLSKTIFSKDELPFIDQSISKAIINIDTNLSILPAGPIPPNPSELVASSRFHFVLSRIKSMYDFVILDTPPILPASDALLLAHQVDGVIIVVKTAYLNRNLIGNAINQIQDIKANLLGIVLNQVDIKREGYYKYYQKYYTGYYGEQENKSS